MMLMAEKILIIAEKPSVARDICAALGGFKLSAGGFYESPSAIVSSAVGHLVEIFSKEAEATGKDLSTLPVIPKPFELRPITRTQKQLALLKKLIYRPDVGTVVNACDAGREGELIFRLVYEFCNCRKPMKRMWLQSMTTAAIQTAYNKMAPGSQYDALAQAARSRAEADWLIGINGTRAVSMLWMRQTQKYEVMGVGRVQTPTLGMIVQREHEIRNFVPRPFFEVIGHFKIASGEYTGRWNQSGAETEGNGDNSDKNRFFEKEKALAVLQKCQGVTPEKTSEVSQTEKKNAPKLFDLTTLQREANKHFGLSAKETLGIAQDLYEKHKVTTYPRTDSSALPEDSGYSLKFPTNIHWLEKFYKIHELVSPINGFLMMLRSAITLRSFQMATMQLD